jgi:hypothetical protein
VSDPDPLRATWAGIRADQLTEAAWELERHSRALANRVWRHAACLDPDRPDFAHALQRTAPVRWARPQILSARAVEGEGLPAPLGEGTWELERPIRVVAARTAPPQESSEAAPERLQPTLVDLAEPIAAAEKALREARFELALEWVERGRRQLEIQGPAQEQSGQRAQLEVLAATAEIALGREDAARASLTRALRAQSELSLDPARHSPKLVGLFEEVRGGEGPLP